MAATLSRALMNTLMGMGTVFVVLIFISLIISLFKYVPQIEKALADRKNRKEKQNAPKADRPEPKRPVITLEEEDEEEELAGEELIAVITAAIVASSGGAVSADQLRIRSVRRRRAGRRK